MQRYRTKMRVKLSAIVIMMCLVLGNVNVLGNTNTEVMAQSYGKTVTKKKTTASDKKLVGATLSQEQFYDDLKSEKRINRYKEKLSENEKKFYDQVEAFIYSKLSEYDSEEKNFTVIVGGENSGLYELKVTGLGSFGLKGENLEKIYIALDGAHPEWYWLHNKYRGDDITEDGIINNFIVYGYGRYAKYEDRKKVETQLIDVIKDYLNEIESKGFTTVYEKEKYIHDRIIKNATYYDGAEPQTDSHNMIGVLLGEGKGCCESYAKASQILFDLCGIDNYFVAGIATQPGDINHAFNIVNLKATSTDPDEWYIYDATNDDVDQVSNLQPIYENISYQLFNRSNASIGYESKYDYIYGRGLCNEENYNYFNQTPGCYYISSKSQDKVKAVFNQIKDDISHGLIPKSDMGYQVRIGKGFTEELTSVKSYLSDENIAYYSQYGIPDDAFVYFGRPGKYELMVKEYDTSKMKLYLTQEEIKANQVWPQNGYYNLNLDCNSFYVKLLNSDLHITRLQYKKASGEWEEASTQTNVKQTIEDTSIYRCELPIEVQNNDKIEIKIEANRNPQPEIEVNCNTVTPKYGKKTNFTVKVKGELLDQPTGKVTLYLNSKEDVNKLGEGTLSLTDGVPTITKDLDLRSGKHKLFIEYSGDEHYSSTFLITTEIEIQKVHPTIAIDNHSATYNGEIVVMPHPIIAGVNNETKDWKVSYKYYKDDACSIETDATDGAETKGGAPANVGNYYVKVIVDEIDDYAQTEVKKNLTITKATISDKTQEYKVTEGVALDYEFELEKITNQIGFSIGTPTYTIKSTTDAAGMLDRAPEISGRFLKISTQATVREGNTCEIKMEVSSKNIVPFIATIRVTTVSKRKVKILGVTMDNVVYNGNSYPYTGSPTIMTEDTNSRVTNASIVLYYQGMTCLNQAYSSVDAPIIPGEYELIVSIPENNPMYTGSTSCPFNIERAKVVVTAEDKRVGLGEQVEYTSKVTGLVGFDSFTGIEYSCEYDPENRDSSNVKDYPIKVSGGILTNADFYDVEYKEAVLSIYKQYSISFVSEDSDGIAPTMSDKESGEAFQLPKNTFIRNDFIFQGWMCDGSLYEENQTFVMPKKDITFIAVWKKKPEVKITKITANYKDATIAVGTQLEKDSIELYAHYSDGSKKQITDFSFTAVKVDTTGLKEYSISYGDFTTEFTVTAVVKTPTSITASYTGKVVIGKDIDKNNLKVEVYYNDNSKNVVTSNYTIESYKIVEGENTLTVAYQGMKANFKVLGVREQNANVCSVTFDSQGGTSVSTQYLSKGSKVTYFPTTTKSGYSFQGWFTGVNGAGERLTSAVIIDTDVTYYAYWKDTAANLISISATYVGDHRPGEVTKSNFIVTGKYADGTSGRIYDFTITAPPLKVGSNSIVISYGNYTTNISVLVDDVSVVRIDAIYRGKPLTSGNIIDPDDIRVVAYKGDGTSEEVTNFTLSDNQIRLGTNKIKISYKNFSTMLEVTGHQCYDVYFDTNGGNAIKAKQVVSGQIVGALPIPTKEFNEFEGWYKDESFTKKCNANLVITRDTILYAKWREVIPYKLNTKYMTLKKNGEESIFVIGTEDVFYYCENTNIAMVDQDGIVTGIKNGTTTITATTGDGFEFKCLVTVGPTVNKIKTNVKEKTLKKGKTFKLKAVAYPKKALLKKVTYQSSNEKIATVSKSGKITAKQKGECYIYVKATDAGQKKVKVKIIVK